MDALVAVGVIAMLWFAFYRVGLWRFFWIGLVVYVGGFELYSVLVTKQTISQQFWAYTELHPLQGWLLGGLILLGALGLVIHLLWKQIKKWKS